MTERAVEYTTAKSKMAVTVTSYRRHLILTNCNNLKIILLAPIILNNLQNKNCVFLRGNGRFVYKSKMAAKRRV